MVADVSHRDSPNQNEQEEREPGGEALHVGLSQTKGKAPQLRERSAGGAGERIQTIEF